MYISGLYISVCMRDRERKVCMSEWVPCTILPLHPSQPSVRPTPRITTAHFACIYMCAYIRNTGLYTRTHKCLLLGRARVLVSRATLCHRAQPWSRWSGGEGGGGGVAGHGTELYISVFTCAVASKISNRQSLQVCVCAHKQPGEEKMCQRSRAHASAPQSTRVR